MKYAARVNLLDVFGLALPLPAFTPKTYMIVFQKNYCPAFIFQLFVLNELPLVLIA